LIGGGNSFSACDEAAVKQKARSSSPGCAFVFMSGWASEDLREVRGTTAADDGPPRRFFKGRRELSLPAH
jgi:hypothetical protein